MRYEVVRIGRTHSPRRIWLAQCMTTARTFAGCTSVSLRARCRDGVFCITGEDSTKSPGLESPVVSKAKKRSKDDGKSSETTVKKVERKALTAPRGAEPTLPEDRPEVSATKRPRHRQSGERETGARSQPRDVPSDRRGRAAGRPPLPLTVSSQGFLVPPIGSSGSSTQDTQN